MPGNKKRPVVLPTQPAMSGEKSILKPSLTEFIINHLTNKSMKFYTCFSHWYLRKWKKCKLPARLWAWLIDNRFYGPRQIIMRINLVAFFIALAMLKVTASVRAQNISLSFENAPIEKVFESIEKQSGYIFWYDKAILRSASRISVKIKNGNLSETLERCFEGQPLQYQIVEKTIVVKARPEKARPEQSNTSTQMDISGKVVDENGQPLAGASVKVKESTLSAMTNNEGIFRIINAPDNAVLVISYIGFQTREITASSNVLATLERSTSKLDEVQVMAYGTTTQRLNTGSITKVTADDISKQPVSNPLSALQGRVAGLTVSPTMGAPGSAIRIELRGQNSLATTVSGARDITSDPLIIIDGIPFAPNNTNLNRLSSAVDAGTSNGGLSPLNSINPSDIESIEVLKDADATAIYGSRGGNGVILITTKRGKSGKTSITANIYSGISQSAIIPKFTNTEQYIEIRKEALRNDGITPTISNAYDLTQFDQTKYTNIPELLLGGTAGTTDAQISVSGGNNQTSILLSGSIRKETTVLPSEFGDTRASFHANISNNLFNNKLRTIFTASYSGDVNKIAPSSVLNNILTLEPNTPDFVDQNGKLQWYYNNAPIQNILATMRTIYQANTNNLIGNFQINYQLLEGLNLKSNFGYNKIATDEISKSFAANSDPTYNPTGSANFGRSEFSGWNVEPQLEYKTRISKGNLTILTGATWQANDYKGNNIRAIGYSNDALVGSISAAATVNYSDSFFQYKYQAFFGRINYNWRDRYILNLTGRRDGSSRFGPGRQFGNFGAIGAAWIFSNEEFLSKAGRFLSYGKLRGSYGITGTDQIGNYQFMDSWSSSTYSYQGSPGIYPTRLANDDYSWEKNKKAEIGLELGFLKDRFLVTASYFRNVGDNHLVSYPMAAQTGFSTVTRNFPAVITNSGWEFTAISKNIVTTNFSWTTAGNISFTRNVLSSFPNIALSPYNSIYQVGESLDVIRGYKSIGVNPQTGLFGFRDIDGNGIYNSNDYVKLGNFNPKFFGGINNSITYKRLQLDFFLEFKKQTSRNFLSSYYGSTFPGAQYASSLPAELLDRWQKPGDVSKYQKFTTTSTGSSFFNGSNSITISDASYMRLKTVSLSYKLPGEFISRLKIQNCRIYVQGQNLLTITGFKVIDPEMQVLNILPPLRTVTAGLQLTL